MPQVRVITDSDVRDDDSRCNDNDDDVRDTGDVRDNDVDGNARGDDDVIHKSNTRDASRWCGFQVGRVGANRHEVKPVV
jgi:hypothetical protein